ncbi:zinc-binding dehydrogenase [Rhodobaculum claviforme]|uniref:Zinc-binding dehydrogenase n=1 Tax=Rhodobaculum claviforme TaxID=1549854 RepID=A0A934WJK9_9RHOB|nr:zinc-binding dehydrogenase [Rhodobaculum claviforme]MBK5927613.1 zinc-binding dehydrogenase [Rhodobaculum claviforme]
MRSIKAAVCHDFNAPLRVEQVHLRPPGAGEVEVTLEAVAICHSDISYAEGAWGGDLPAVYGHEAAGRITAIGPGVTGWAEGQRVIVTLIRSCGGCASCASGAPVYCRDAPALAPPLTTATGGALKQGLACGAFAEAVVVQPSQLAAVPDDMPAEQACLLACGVVTGLGAAVHTAAVRPGEVVVVIGAGGVGLNAIQGARLAGASRIIAVDMSADKLEAARAFGATDGVLAGDAKPWRAARDAAGGRAADVVLVTVGAIPAYQVAMRYLAPRGRMVMVGMPHSGEVASYEPVVVAAQGQAMVGSLMGEVVLGRDIPWMVDLWRQGRLELAGLISGRWALEHINEAIADTRAGHARRNVILMDG